MPPPQDIDTAPVFRLQIADGTGLFLDFDDAGHLTVKPLDTVNPARQKFRFYRAGKVQNVALQGNTGDGGYLTRREFGDDVVVHLETQHGNDEIQRWNNKPGALRGAVPFAKDQVFTLIVTPLHPNKNGILRSLGRDQKVVVVGWMPYEEWNKDAADAVERDRQWNCFRVS